MDHKNLARKMTACALGLAMLVGGIFSLQTPVEGQTGCPEYTCPSGCDDLFYGCAPDLACLYPGCGYVYMDCDDTIQICTLGCCHWG